MTSADDDRGALLVRYEVDPAEERIFARVRYAGALLGALGSLALLLGRLPLPVFFVGVLGLVISLAWLKQARRAETRAREATRHHLSLFAQGVLLAEGGTPIWLPWSEVREVEVDEELLVVVLRRAADIPPLRLEPRYPGVEIHELVRRLRNAWLAWRDQVKNP